MDLNIVYAKTQAGEQAVQERTRVIQRSLRNVLIMVDGRSTVFELCDKVGEAKLVESALTQLEADGYIQPRLDQSSAWDRRLQAAAEVREAASKKFSELRGRPPASEREAEPVGLPGPAPQNLAPSPVTSPAEPESVPDPAASPAPQPLIAGEGEKPVEGLLPGWFKGGEETRDGDRAFSTDDWRAEKIVIKPIRRGPRRRPGLYGWLGIGIVTLLVVMLLAVFAFPFSIYQADLEAGLAKALGQRVRIGAVHGSLSPSPVLVLDDVQIGNAGEIVISELHLAPALGSLFGSPRVFREVAVFGVRMPAESLSALVPAITRLAQGESFSVRHVTISRAEFVLRDVVLADLSGEIAVAADGRTSRLRLRNPDATLRLEFAPGEAGVVASIEATGWKPVAGSALVWDALTVQGTLAGPSFVGTKLSGRLLDGVAQGQMRLDWWADGVVLRADFGVERVSAKRLGEGLGAGMSLDGVVDGRMRMVAMAERVAALPERATLEGRFMMRRALVDGLDFVEAVRRGQTSSTRGGATRFDQLAGNWTWDGQFLRLSALDGGSGALQTTGGLMVGAGQQVTGRFDVRLKGVAADFGMPVTLSGTLKDPELQWDRR